MSVESIFIPQVTKEVEDANVFLCSCRPTGEHYHIIIMYNSKVLIEDSVHNREEFIGNVSKFFSQVFEQKEAKNGEGELSREELNGVLSKKV